MMGWLAKAFGRWGDDTAKISRGVAHYLDPDEEVLVAVVVQSPGTNAAGLAAGASAGVSGATGLHGAVFRDDTKKLSLWMKQAAKVGIDAELARRTVRLVVVVTTSRLLLVRRGVYTGRMLDLLAAWPAGDVDRVKVPRNGTTLRILRGDAELTCELPNAHRFIAQVYRDLPTVFAQMQEAVRTDPES